jgi:hypothetical protein
MMLLFLLAQDQGARTVDVPNAMGAHTWFVIAIVGAFLAWSISYSLQQRRERLARKKGRDDLARRKDEIIERIATLEAEKEAGSVDEKKYKQELKELKFRLSKLLEKPKESASGEARNARR